jgi:hypothetical protein
MTRRFLGTAFGRGLLPAVLALAIGVLPVTQCLDAAMADAGSEMPCCAQAAHDCPMDQQADRCCITSPAADPQIAPAKVQPSAGVQPVAALTWLAFTPVRASRPAAEAPEHRARSAPLYLALSTLRI